MMALEEKFDLQLDEEGEFWACDAWERHDASHQSKGVWK